jgi:hypothetical protein
VSLGWLLSHEPALQEVASENGLTPWTVMWSDVHASRERAMQLAPFQVGSESMV